MRISPDQRPSPDGAPRRTCATCGAELELDRQTGTCRCAGCGTVFLGPVAGSAARADPPRPGAWSPANPTLLTARRTAAALLAILRHDAIWYRPPGDG